MLLRKSPTVLTTSRPGLRACVSHGTYFTSVPPHSPAAPPTSHLMFLTYPTCISRIPMSGREVDGRFSSPIQRWMRYRGRSQSGCTTTHNSWQTQDTYSFPRLTSCKLLEYDECNISQTIHRDSVCTHALRKPRTFRLLQHDYDDPTGQPLGPTQLP